MAERQAREEVRTRAAVQKRLILDQRERREEELRELANKARMERGGGGGSGGATTSTVAAAATAGPRGVSNLPAWMTKRDEGKEVVDSSVVDYLDDENDNNKFVESVTQRQRSSIDKNNVNEEEHARGQCYRLRAERRHEREKEYHFELASMANPDDDAVDDELKKKQRLENDRDVSKKVALGTHRCGWCRWRRLTFILPKLWPHVGIRCQ